MDGVVAVNTGYHYQTAAISNDGVLGGIFTPTMENTAVTAVSVGYLHGAIITADGSLWTWGQNWCGQLGDGTTEDHNVKKVMDNVVAVSAGWNHTIAITTDGTLWAWGGNNCGQLGNGKFGNDSFSSVPVKVMENVEIASAGGD